jgi:hypothetical protein
VRLGGRCPFSAVGPVARTRCRSTPFTGRPVSAAPRFLRSANRPPSPESDARSVGYPTPSHPGLAAGFPAAVPPQPRCPANRTPLPESKPGLSANRPPLLLAAVHADPVSRVIDLDAAGRHPREQLGCSLGLGPVCPVPVASGCPATRYPERVASRSVRTRSRLVDRGRFPSPAPRRRPSKDSVSRSRLACAARYGSYSREPETPGQAVLLNPQGYPPNFRPIPRILCRVHRAFTRSCTGCPQSVGEFRRFQV